MHTQASEVDELAAQSERTPFVAAPIDCPPTPADQDDEWAEIVDYEEEAIIGLWIMGALAIGVAIGVVGTLTLQALT